MPSFFLALLATALAAFGGRDQLLLARLAERHGPSDALLAIAWLASAITAAFAAWAGVALAALLPPAAKSMLAAIALLLAGAEMAIPWRWRRMEEPTRSTVATLIVLVAAQVGDGARFLILAVAVATGNPVLAALGGAVGGGAALTLGWMQAGALAGAGWLRALRLGIGAALFLTGLVIGLSARGILD